MAVTVVNADGTGASWLGPVATLLAVVVGGVINIVATRLADNRKARLELTARAARGYARTVAALASLSTLGEVIRGRRETTSFEIPLGSAFFRHIEAQCARFEESANDLHAFLDAPTVESLYDYFDTLAFMSATMEEVDRTSTEHFLNTREQSTLKTQADMFLARGNEAAALRVAVMKLRPGRS